MRFESPDSRNRWDSPVFTVHAADFLPFDDIHQVLYHRQPAPPNLSTLPVSNEHLSAFAAEHCGYYVIVHYTLYCFFLVIFFVIGHFAIVKFNLVFSPVCTGSAIAVCDQFSTRTRHSDAVSCHGLLSVSALLKSFCGWCHSCCHISKAHHFHCSWVMVIMCLVSYFRLYWLFVYVQHHFELHCQNVLSW